MKLRVTPTLYLTDAAGNERPLSQALNLLAAVKTDGSLRTACTRLGVPYRSGWQLLIELEKQMGGAIVEMTRGRGSSLTRLGERLIGAQQLVEARVGTILESISTEIDAEIQGALNEARNNLRVFASHGFAIALLGQFLQQQRASVDLTYRGSVEALDCVVRGSCEVAGFHLPIGELERDAMLQLDGLLDPELVFMGLASRRQGLMVAPGNPHAIWNIEDLFKDGVQFVNRQPGSGTRVILDLLLKRAGQQGIAIHGYDNVELTHAAVAAFVASGKADVGIGVEAAARQFGLDFVPLISERYFLAYANRSNKDARLAPILSLLKSPQFRGEVNRIPGYDSGISGQQFRVDGSPPRMNAIT